MMWGFDEISQVCSFLYLKRLVNILISMSTHCNLAWKSKLNLPRPLIRRDSNGLVAFDLAFWRPWRYSAISLSWRYTIIDRTSVILQEPSTIIWSNAKTNSTLLLLWSCTETKVGVPVFAGVENSPLLPDCSGASSEVSTARSWGSGPMSILFASECVKL